MAEKDSEQGMTLEEGIKALIRRFDLIIGLLVDGPPDPETEKSAEGKTIRLARIGMRPIEIARLTGRDERNVSRDLSKARKQGKLPRGSKPLRSRARQRRKRRK